MRVTTIAPTCAAWRGAARALLEQDVPASAVAWQVRGDTSAGSLWEHAPSAAAIDEDDDRDRVTSVGAAAPRVPSAFLALADSVACHGSGQQWDALYRVLYRLTHGEPRLLEVATDPDVHRLHVMDKAVRRAVHKMHAFVRFRAVQADAAAPAGATDAERTLYVAWFEPPHPVVQRAAPFFARRFASMRWSVLTPSCCAHWDRERLHFTPGVTRDAAPSEDELEALWCGYYAHIFNPARVAVATMRAEMPQQYWRNLPEARLIDTLTREAPARVRRMLAQADAPAPPLPADLESCERAPSEPVRAPIIPATLDTPGAWDPVHDPGVSAARRRAEAARARVDGTSDGASHVASESMSPVTALRVHDVPVRVGTASWTDPTLVHPGVFYPPGVHSAEERLRYYAHRFPLVEVDATYYVPPTRAMAAAWVARTPEHFVFDIKAYALMTGHAADTRRLPDWLRRLLPRTLLGQPRLQASAVPSEVLDAVWIRFLEALSPLHEAGKMGPVLLQFPRWFEPSRTSADVLRAARRRLGRHAGAVEFRNPAWMTGRVAARTLALLESLELTYVVVDAPPGTSSSMPPVVAVTTPGFAMMRLHGRRTDAWEATHAVVSERYRYLYDASEQEELASRLVSLTAALQQDAPQFPDMAKARQGVHVLYNNCHANYGTSNADEITALLVGFDEERRATRMTTRMTPRRMESGATTPATGA